MARHNVREQIVEAGLKVLLEKGFNGCGVQDITQAAGVPKGSFYNHFESKEALGALIVERYAAGDGRREILTDPSTRPLDRLLRHFERLNAKYDALNFERGCLLANFSAELADHSPLIRDRLAAVYREWTEQITVAIRDGQADSSISRDLPAKDLAAFLLDAYEGAVLRAKVERTRAPLDRFMTLAFTRILT